MRRVLWAVAPGLFVRSAEPTPAVRGTPMTRKLAWRSVLAALLRLVEAAGQAQAGEILTYTYITDSVIQGEAVSGSFQVDSSHIHTVVDTDISSFIIHLAFTGGGSSSPFGLPAFSPLDVTVTPTGDLTRGSGFGILQGFDPSSTFDLIVNASGRSDQEYKVNSTSGDLVSSGVGHWTHTLLPLPAVPEPSTLVLATIGGVGALGYRWRRKRA
jgi:PEP-CTERM motif